MDNWANKIARYFVTHNIITLDQFEWCTYSLQVRLERTFAALIFFLIGSFTHQLIESFIFLFTFSFIRSKSNGYHIDSYIGCLIQSIICFILGMMMGQGLRFPVNIILLVVSSLIIWCLSPVNNNSIHFSVSEMSILRRSVRQRIFFVFLCIVFTMHINPCLANFSIASLTLVSILLVLSRCGFGIQ